MKLVLQGSKRPDCGGELWEGLVWTRPQPDSWTRRKTILCRFAERFPGSPMHLCWELQSSSSSRCCPLTAAGAPRLMQGRRGRSTLQAPSLDAGADALPLWDCGWPGRRCPEGTRLLELGGGVRLPHHLLPWEEEYWRTNRGLMPPGGPRQSHRSVGMVCAPSTASKGSWCWDAWGDPSGNLEDAWGTNWECSARGSPSKGAGGKGWGMGKGERQRWFRAMECPGRNNSSAGGSFGHHRVRTKAVRKCSEGGHRDGE